jgi:hypothetical protein
MQILRVEREVEAVGVAEGRCVRGGGAFAEHLSDGVSGDEMDEEKDDRDHHPEDWEGDEDAADGLGKSCQFSVLSSQLLYLIVHR